MSVLYKLPFCPYCGVVDFIDTCECEISIAIKEIDRAFDDLFLVIAIEESSSVDEFRAPATLPDSHLD